MTAKEKLRQKLYSRDGKCCYYCEIKEEDFIPTWGVFYKGRGKRLELERKDSEKGYNTLNCILACAICNNAKSNKFTYKEFLGVGKAIKKVWHLRVKNKGLKEIIR